MSDIFIRYKREEQAIARKLANALENQGWTVWWDPTFQVGENFFDVIERELQGAKCVIVMWSRLSVQSEYVKHDALYALARKKLAPVAIEEVELPFPFEVIHTPQLIDWDGSVESPEFQKMLEDINSIIGSFPALAKAEVEEKRRADEEQCRYAAAEREIDVFFGTSTPPVVSPGETFVARFAAYTDSNRNKIIETLTQESKSSQKRMDLDTCRWRRGTKATVRLETNAAKVLNPVQNFVWNGAWQILRFDVSVLDNIVSKTLILRFDVAVEGLSIIALRPEIEVVNDEQPNRGTAKSSFFEKPAPKTAFASYATGDRREVLGRVRSLNIFTGIDVFLDCLSLRPGDEWKSKLRDEISNRDVFWLFWSRRAKESEWVEWEWRTALALKTLNGIQPHPLEPMELAPPPKELSVLQFGAMYEWYISETRESWIACYVRILWYTITRPFRNLRTRE